ncbi:Signal transduction histidine-protein kinase BarA [compost metagenome]
MGVEEPIHILLVDDCPKSLVALEAVLDSEPYNLVKAASGEEALRLLHRDSYAVIVLDVQMPGTNGIETVKLIKTQEKSKEIPIIFTVDECTEAMQLYAGSSTGVIDYVMKPFVPQVIKSKIDGFVDMYQTNQRLKAQSMLLQQKTQELERIYEELMRAREAAEIAVRAKTEFLAMMSHEIRTPMNGVIGMIDVLMETELKDEQKEYAQIIRGSADTLSTVINDILDFTNMESGIMVLEESPFELRAAIEDVIGMFVMDARNKNLELVCVIQEDVPAILYGDMGRLRQVLIQLITNAMKFTEEGGIYLFVSVAGKDEDKYVLEFTVKDTGVGIAPDKIDSLFKPFSQLDSPMTRKHGGTGLGLAICQTLVHMMGGEIGLDVENENGAAFNFTICAYSVESPEAPGVYFDSRVEMKGYV